MSINFNNTLNNSIFERNYERAKKYTEESLEELVKFFCPYPDYGKFKSEIGGYVKSITEYFDAPIADKQDIIDDVISEANNSYEELDGNYKELEKELDDSKDKISELENELDVANGRISELESQL